MRGQLRQERFQQVDLGRPESAPYVRVVDSMGDNLEASTFESFKDVLSYP